MFSNVRPRAPRNLMVGCESANLMGQTWTVSPRRTWSSAELVEVAEGLRRLLRSIEAGELSADVGMVARLEGALMVVDALPEGRRPTP